MNKTHIGLLGFVALTALSTPSYGMWSRMGHKIKRPAMALTQLSGSFLSGWYAGYIKETEKVITKTTCEKPNYKLETFDSPPYGNWDNVKVEKFSKPPYPQILFAHGVCIGLGAHAIKTLVVPSIAWPTKALAGACLAACTFGYDTGDQYGWITNINKK